MPSLKVQHIHYPTPDSVEISFELEGRNAKNYSSLPGQYVTLKPVINGIEWSRCYSVTGSEKMGSFSVCVKRVPNGVVSNYLFEQVRIGDQLNVTFPEGNFTLNRKNTRKGHDYIFITGGSGITPLIPMIRKLINNPTVDRITLIYGNRDVSGIIYKDLLDSFSDKLNVVHVLEHVPDTENHPYVKGVLSVETIQSCLVQVLQKSHKTIFFLSGPPIVIDNSEKVLKSININSKNIFLERFFIDSTKFADGKDHNVRIFTSSGVNKVHVPRQSSVLDACLNAGKQIDYSCRSGDCKKCACRLLKGEVNYDGNILSEQKDILACQTFPLNDEVVIDFREGILKRIAKHRTFLLFSLFILSILIIIGLRQQKGPSFIAHGPMTIGHENVSCVRCHRDEKGTTREQLQSQAGSIFSNEVHTLHFGKKPVTNSECLNCHKRENDIHPVHRFTEPKFKKAREKIHPEQCVSCHIEHNGMRVTITETGYCINCHQNLSLKLDPIRPTHEKLVNSGQWKMCLQCHDFHGNHVRETPTRLKDTISIKQLTEYFNGGEDPYSPKKQFKALKKQ